MRLLARINLAASLAAVVLTAACSDSSGPSAADQATAVAARFDSIYVDATAQSDGGANAFALRAIFASLLELPAALGAVPSTIHVTTASGIETWKGFEVVELPAPGSPDSLFILLAYREAAAHTMLAVIFDSSGSPQLPLLVTGDTVPVEPTALGGATTLISVGAPCRTPPISLTNPEFQLPPESSCSLASFRTSLSMQFAVAPGVDAALASLTFAPTAINGIREVDPVQGRRVNALLQALRNAKRL